MNIQEIMTIDKNIRVEKFDIILITEPAKISALSLGKIDKY